MLGVVLILMGGAVLAARTLGFSIGGLLWPLWILGPGLLLLAGMAFLGKDAVWLAIPGSVVTAVGLLLLYQNTFNHWESWAYAWALIMPTSIGIGLALMGRRQNNTALVARGSQFVAVGVVLFIIGGIFFELILNISNSLAGNVLWPGLLIALGLLVIMRSSRRRADAASSPASARPVETPPVEAPARPIETPQATPEPSFEPLDMGKK